MEKDDFLKKLEKLVAHAKSKHNTVDAGEINDFFVGDNLSPEQMDQIYSYLENRNIDVVPVLDEAMLNADPALDDIGLDLDLDDDSFIILSYLSFFILIIIHFSLLIPCINF